MIISEVMTQIRADNAAQGWEAKVTPEDPKMVAEKLLLVVSEIIEAYEEWRNGRRVDEVYFKGSEESSMAKPEGIPIELADAVIRIFDFAEANGIDLEHCIHLKLAYNRTRPYRHGGKTA